MDVVITPELIISRSGSLPAFPTVVTDILESIDDESSSLRIVANYAERDPVITGKIFAYANAAGTHTMAGESPRDVFTALSLIGISKVRQIALSFGTVGFLRSVPQPSVSSYFWEHSVAVGICAQRLARDRQGATDYALVAGLLHDVGQLWMEINFPAEFGRAKQAVDANQTDIIDAERAEFGGIDHAVIGEILATHWGLPGIVTRAIRYHHAPDDGLPEKLVAITHVAEVLSNALDLTGRNDNHVNNLSPRACECLSLDWNADLTQLFGEIEASSEFACAAFRSEPSPQTKTALQKESRLNTGGDGGT